MAIAPIDLQTLFTQMDKAGKTHLPQKEGQPLQQMIQTIQSQKKDEELINQVKEMQESDEGAEKVNDNGQNNQENASDGRKRGQDEKPEEKKVSVFSDPSLGKNIDITL